MAPSGEAFLASNYKVQKDLARGAFGKVQKVAHRKSGEVFALKTLDETGLLSSCVLEEEQELLRLQHGFRHPRVVRLFNSLHASLQIWCLLEYADGGTLAQCLSKKHRLLEKTATVLFADVAQGLHYLHEQGVAHRGLVAEKVLLFGDSKPRAKILGLGRKVVATEDWVQKQLAANLLDFYAPEVLQRLQQDPLSDLWSLGVLLYKMLTGKLPFTEEAVGVKLNVEKVKKCEVNLNGWPTGALDLLKGLLRIRSQKRMALQEALKDPWLKAKERRFTDGEQLVVGKRLGAGLASLAVLGEESTDSSLAPTDSRRCSKELHPGLWSKAPDSLRHGGSDPAIPALTAALAPDLASSREKDFRQCHSAPSVLTTIVDQVISWSSELPTSLGTSFSSPTEPEEFMSIQGLEDPCLPEADRPEVQMPRESIVYTARQPREKGRVSKNRAVHEWLVGRP